MIGIKQIKGKNLKPTVEEVYRMLQMRMNSIMNAENMKVIAFTSVIQCEEKSAHIYNLAKSMVVEGKNVLIIDCNMDTHKIYKHLGIDMETIGIEEAREENYKFIFEVPEIKGLYFVLLGEILNIEEITEFVKNIKEEYDIIFIDSPPAGIVAEGIKLSIIADGTVLVVQSGKTPKDLSKKMKVMFDSVNVTVLGVILEE